jgi:COMPASS component SPP1
MSRRLDISSLLCNDDTPSDTIVLASHLTHRSNPSHHPHQSPTTTVSALGGLEALVQAATEERRRLSVSDSELPHDDKRHSQPIISPPPHHRSSWVQPPTSPPDFIRPPIHHHFIVNEKEEDPVRSPIDGFRTLASPYPPPPPRQQYHEDHRIHIQRQRQHHEQLLQQEQLLHHQRAQEAEHQQRVQDMERVHRQQEVERQQRLQEVERHRMQEKQRFQELERQQRSQEQQRMQELERQRIQELDYRQQRALEQERHIRMQEERQRRSQEMEHHQLLRQEELRRPVVPLEPRMIEIPPHIQPTPRKSDPIQINIPATPTRPDPLVPTSVSQPLPRDQPRPAKKRRYSESPSRPDEKERIAAEREKMSVGELGYGRVEHPVAGPSSIPRRPGSGNGRKAIVPSEEKPALLGITIEARSVSRDRDAHRVLSPLGRRSPPGSQIGRAKAARKSDEHLDRREHLHHVPHPVAHEVPKKNKEDEPKSRHRHLEESQVGSESSRPKKAKEVKEQRPPLAIPKEQQDDPHEWLLEHYADQPSPSTSVRLEPPRSPSPSLSPVISTLPVTNSASRTPTPPPTKLTPYPPAPRPDIAVTLEDELEELVSKPTHVAKQEQDVDMDVDLAVTELVAETLNEDADKAQHVGMEVDDELLSLVDDRLPVQSSSSRRATSTAMSLVGTLQPSKSTSRPAGDKRPASPFALTTPVSTTLLSVARSSSSHPTPERGSMPPPASINVSTSSRGKDKDDSGTTKKERAGSVAPTATTKKKKEANAKVRCFFFSHKFSM